MTFTKSEIVNLILNYYTDSHGYWKNDVENHAEALKFIHAGFSDLNDLGDKYILNTDGQTFLGANIGNITNQFTNYLRQNNGVCFVDKVTTWFSDNFYLVDPEIIERISNYILRNAKNRNIIITKTHLHNVGFVYELSE